MNNVTSENQYPWANKLNARIDEVFSTLKEEIDIKVKQLIDQDLLDIPEENAVITEYYSTLYSNSFRIKTVLNSYTYTLFHDQISKELISDDCRIKLNDKAINYFFVKKYDKFWNKVVQVYKDTMEDDPSSFSLTNHLHYLELSKEGVLNYVAEVIGRFNASQYAYNVVRNNGAYREMSQQISSFLKTDAELKIGKQDHVLRSIALYYISNELDFIFENNEQRVKLLFFLSGYQLTENYKFTSTIKPVKKVFKHGVAAKDRFSKKNLEWVLEIFKELKANKICNKIEADLNTFD